MDITGEAMQVEVVNATSSDTSTTLINPEPGSLQLFDLGYFSLPVLQQITDACYLCRLKYNTQVWIKTQNGFERLNRKQQINKMQAGQLIEMEVYLGADKAIKTRLIIEKVPEELAAQKRRKLKTDKINKRKNISKGRLAFCTLNVYVTSAAANQISTENIRAVYGLRWQIEILFKTWKSYMNIDKIESMNVDRFNCTHYGTLIYILLTSKLFFYFKYQMWQTKSIELSELKAMKLMSRSKTLIWNILFAATHKACEELEMLQDNLFQNCIKERKKHKPRPYETISYALS